MKKCLSVRSSEWVLLPLVLLGGADFAFWVALLSRPSFGVALRFPPPSMGCCCSLLPSIRVVLLGLLLLVVRCCVPHAPSACGAALPCGWCCFHLHLLLLGRVGWPPPFLRGAVFLTLLRVVLLFPSPLWMVLSLLLFF